MKKMFEKKLALLLAALLLAVGGAFISCSSDDDGGDNKKPSTEQKPSDDENKGDGEEEGDEEEKKEDEDEPEALVYSVALGADEARVELSKVEVNGEVTFYEKQTITGSFGQGYKVENLSGADDWTVAFTFTVTSVGSDIWNDFNWEIRDNSTNQNSGAGYWSGRYDNYMVGWLDGYHEFSKWWPEDTVHFVEEGNAAFGGHWYGVTVNKLDLPKEGETPTHSDTLNKTCVLTFNYTAEAITVSLTSDGTEVWKCVNEAV